MGLRSQRLLLCAVIFLIACDAIRARGQLIANARNVVMMIERFRVRLSRGERAFRAGFLHSSVYPLKFSVLFLIQVCNVVDLAFSIEGSQSAFAVASKLERLPSERGVLICAVDFWLCCRSVFDGIVIAGCGCVIQPSFLPCAQFGRGVSCDLLDESRLKV